MMPIFEKVENTMERLFMVVPILIAAYLASTLTGCSGMEAYSSIGIRRVDEHRESARTYNKPMKCLFIPCNANDYASNEGSGS